MKSWWKSYSRQDWFRDWFYSSWIWCRDWEIIPSLVNKADQPWTLLTAVLMPLSSTMCCPCAWKWCFHCCTLGGRPESSAPSQDNINTPRGQFQWLSRAGMWPEDRPEHLSQADQASPATKAQHVKTDFTGQVPALCCSCTELSMSSWVKNHQPILILYHSLQSSQSSLFFWLFYRTNSEPPEDPDLSKLSRLVKC